MTMKDTTDGHLDERGAISRTIPAERRLKKHNKSRAGCLRCKAKRIKCSESKPKCHHCLKNAAPCVYPDDRKSPSPLQINIVQSNHLGFNLQDMRLFHDFMTISRPHLPLESEKAWVNDMPIIAQQHEFLMHGMLALGAAHLHAKTNLDLHETVERHRALAMQGLNFMDLTNTSRRQHDARNRESRLSALLATCYALSFASSYMGDSLSLFLVLIRGCSSITQEIVRDGYKCPLLPCDSKSATAEPHLEVMRRRLENVPLLDGEEISRANMSLILAEASYNFLPFQWRLLQIMKAVVADVNDPFKAYSHFVEIWNDFASLPPTDFAVFTDGSDRTSVMLQAHFLAIETLLKPWLVTELNTPVERNGYTALPSSATLESPESGLLQWPLQILEKNRKAFKERYQRS